MNFIGRALPLTPAGIKQAAKCAGAGIPEIMAVMEVETAGCGFLRDKRPVILYERHIFARRTNSRFNESHPQISSDEPGGYGPSGNHQYERLHEAMKLDEDAAIASCSWGLGQVMAFGYKRCGYSSMLSMIKEFMDSEDNQLIAVGEFIRRSGLSDELVSHDWQAFAYGYNGPGFARNNYDVRLAKAYGKWSKGAEMNCVIRSMQMRLLFDGYYTGKIDGIDGPLTRAAIQQAEYEAWCCTDASTPRMY